MYGIPLTIRHHGLTDSDMYQDHGCQVLAKCPAKLHFYKEAKKILILAPYI